ADEIGLAELYELLKTKAQHLRKSVGILSDDNVSLFQPQDALGFDAESFNSEVASTFDQRFPYVQPEAGLHVQLVAQLTGEAQAQQIAAIHAGNAALARSHVRKGRGLQIDFCG